MALDDDNSKYVSLLFIHVDKSNVVRLVFDSFYQQPLLMDDL